MGEGLPIDVKNSEQFSLDTSYLPLEPFTLSHPINLHYVPHTRGIVTPTALALYP